MHTYASTAVLTLHKLLLNVIYIYVMPPMVPTTMHVHVYAPDLS